MLEREALVLELLIQEGYFEGSVKWDMKKQQRTGQAPGGFTDASAAGNSPRFRGLGR